MDLEEVKPPTCPRCPTHPLMELDKTIYTSAYATETYVCKTCWKRVYEHVYEAFAEREVNPTLKEPVEPLITTGICTHCASAPPEPGSYLCVACAALFEFMGAGGRIN